MIDLTLKEIALALNGELLGGENTEEQIINSVSTDTREIKKGNLFVALHGDNFDAHQFIEKAITQGACALLIDKKIKSAQSSILVKDTKIALGQLGALVKSKIKELQIAAITGSNGKTTTKELLAQILSVKAKSTQKVLSTLGNFNNDIGVPLTLLRLKKETKYAVVELGANHMGEIAYTSKLLKPDVALINNVLPAHLEGFGSIEGVAKAKSEIWENIIEGGTGVVNLDDLFSDSNICLLDKLDKKILTFSLTDNKADIYASNITFDDLANGSFLLNINNNSIQITLSLPGKHNISNALAAASLAYALGATLFEIKEGIESCLSVKGRLTPFKVNENLTVIDDTYNANSASVMAAIDALSLISRDENATSTLILGDMGELGGFCEREHKLIGAYAFDKGIDELLTVGTFTKISSKAFNNSGKHFLSKDELKEYLKVDLKNKNNLSVRKILVKGSRSAKMEEIVTFIKNS